MSEQFAHGVVRHPGSSRRTDYLYRISIKSLIRNEKGEVLVVKEAGRTYWDLPGGGMDHGENIMHAIAREMKEEVNLEGSFSYRIITTDEPAYSPKQSFWQLRLIYEIKPRMMQFDAGEDGDEIAFINPDTLKASPSLVEQNIYNYTKLASEAISL